MAHDVLWSISGDGMKKIAGFVKILLFYMGRAHLVLCMPVYYIFLTVEKNNKKSFQNLFHWRILMFYIYHCKGKDNYIAPMYVLHEEQFVFGEGQIFLKNTT